MRSFETDRPDVTESAYTVDAGHFQFETDLFKTDHSSIDGIKTIENSFNVFNLKAGITNSLDIQFIAASYDEIRVMDGKSQPSSHSSFGTLTIRAKQNILGNDNGNTAMAILPFVRVPTNSGSKISGGVVFPFSISLPHNWGFGAQAEMDVEEGHAGGAYHVNPLVSATLAHPLAGPVSFFAEGLAERDNELKTNAYFLNSGLVYEWKENLKLDTGVYYGLKNTSPKVFFVGFSFRY